MTLTPEQLKELRALLEKASPAPWKAAQTKDIGKDWLIGSLNCGCDSETDEDYTLVTTDGVRASHMDSGSAKADCEAIAAIRNHATALIAAAEELEQIKRQAGDATEYALASINRDLTKERDELFENNGYLALEMAKAIDERDRLREALDDLQAKEAAYRKAHDLHGDGDMKSGRAWDALRNSGDRARQALKEGDG